MEAEGSVPSPSGPMDPSGTATRHPFIHRVARSHSMVGRFMALSSVQAAVVFRGVGGVAGYSAVDEDSAAGGGNK